MFSMAIANILFMLLLWVTPSAPQECKTVPVASSFDLNWFTQHTWYLHALKPNRLFNADNAFCALMTFKATNYLSFRKQRFTVDAYANKFVQNGNVDDPLQPLCLSRPDATVPNFLKLSSCLLPAEVGVNFWVATWSNGGGFGDDAAFAVIVEGQPSVLNVTKSCYDNDFCGMKSNQGVYVLTRKAARNSLLVGVAIGIASGTVCLTNQLIDVQQSGCSYAGADIK